MQDRTLANVAHPPVSPRRPVSADQPVSTPQSVGDPVRGSRFAITSPDDPQCVVREVLHRVADKWTALIVTILAGGRLGYAGLRRSTPGISDKMLAQTLHKLEDDGLVSRTVHPTTPVRVTYELTDLGETLVPPLDALRRWALQYGPQLGGQRQQRSA